MAARARFLVSSPDRRLPADHLINLLGDRQDGRVARWQLLEAGITEKEIQVRVAARRLLPLGGGVFAVGHRTPTSRASIITSILAAGPGAAASHGSAAWLHHLLRYPPATNHVVVRDRSPHRIRGTRVHRPSTLEDRDLVVVEGVPATSVERTLLDVCQTAPLLVRAAVGQAERLETFSMAAMEDVLSRVARPRNVRFLLEAIEDPGLPARSSLEEHGHALARAARVPDPEANAMVEASPGNWYEVDLLWRQEMLIVEIDGDAVHRGRIVSEEDARKTEELTSAGFAVIRAPERRLKQQGGAFAENLNRAFWLRHRRAAGRPTPGRGTPGNPPRDRGRPSTPAAQRPRNALRSNTTGPQTYACTTVELWYSASP